MNLFPYQTAIYDALTTALAVPVYDDALQASDFPFVTIGFDAVTDWSTDDYRGIRVLTTVHTWSRYRGNKEIYDLQEQVRAALDRQPITVAGATLVGIDYNSSNVIRDPDGTTRHGVTQFTAYISEE